MNAERPGLKIQWPGASALTPGPSPRRRGEKCVALSQEERGGDSVGVAWLEGRMQSNPGPFFSHQAYELLKSHESMLADVRRNRAFHRALKSCVRSDTCVLDIGSGTGLWAIAAAKLGARRVVAIERN